MNYQYYEQPLKVENNNQVYCPYVKTPNLLANTPVPQPQTLDGKHLKEVCVPNLSYRGPVIKGFGNNICQNNQPVHLNFASNLPKQPQECYSDNTCSQKLETCYDPYIGM